ncbi:MAG: hypothetical protein Kow0031_41880 [Anaerolineae bacterium]
MSRQFTMYGVIAIIITFVAYYAIILLTGDWNRYLIGNLAVSLATFILYGVDKAQAKAFQGNARNRVPENLLHLLALLGGYIGGWAGMFIFWHKVRKPVFIVVLAISTVLHVGLMLLF